jgi:hypothetical protein
LNDKVQDNHTDFRAYDAANDPDNPNANGALNVGAQGYGLYEDNNPWPITIPVDPMDGTAGGAKRALAFLNGADAAAKAQYGTYTIRLGADETDRHPGGHRAGERGIRGHQEHQGNYSCAGGRRCKGWERLRWARATALTRCSRLRSKTTPV